MNVSTTTHFWEVNNCAFWRSIIELSFWPGETPSPRALSPEFDFFSGTGASCSFRHWSGALRRGCSNKGSPLGVHTQLRGGWFRVANSYAAGILQKWMFMRSHNFLTKNGIFGHHCKLYFCSDMTKIQQKLKNVACTWMLVWKTDSEVEKLKNCWLLQNRQC